MQVYADLVMVLNFLVDFLLLLGTNRLSGYPPGAKRVALAAALGGVYAFACLMPGFSFLGNWFWRLVVLGLMAWIAFGWSVSALRRGMVFVLLSFALSGAALAVGRSGMGTLLLAASGLAALCAWGLQGKIRSREYVPIELCYGERRWKLTALRDTGNTLRDPLTGEQVLVAGADMGRKLLGLTQQQLSAPVQTLAEGTIPGLRLIPYRAVGQPGAMLLAVRCPQVRIGNWMGNALVAFAPECFGKADGYQILVGGMV